MNVNHQRGDSLGGHQQTVAAITGGTQGLGLAIAQRVIADGCRAVAICGRDGEKGERAAKLLRGLGADALFVQTDLATTAEPPRFIEQTIAHFGRVSAVVNSAGLSTRGTLLDTTLDLWDRHMAVNLRAPFLVIQAAVEHMTTHNICGSIVNILSMSAHCGQPYLVPYSVSKAGLATLTKNVANAYAHKRIRCNGVLVGWMETPGEAEIQRRFHGGGADWAKRAEKTLPMGQLVQPRQLAGLVSYMLNPNSGVMTGALVDYDQIVAAHTPRDGAVAAGHRAWLVATGF